jgi:hypothetical protein
MKMGVSVNEDGLVRVRRWLYLLLNRLHRRLEPELLLPLLAHGSHIVGGVSVCSRD